MTLRRPRITLIHAMAAAVQPIHTVLDELWPEAESHDLLDTSLPSDLAAGGGVLDRRMIDRFLSLGRYANESAPPGRRPDAILFSCSAFGVAIEAVRDDLAIPVAKPNEAAFTEAARRGGRIALLSTFEPALPSLLRELVDISRGLGVEAEGVGVFVPGALDALQAGKSDRHNALIAAKAAEQRDVDTIVLCAFSMSQALATVQKAVPGATVLTTPRSAVTALRAIVEPRLG